MGTRLFVVPGTLTPALSQRERGRRCGAGPSGRIGDGQRRDGGAERVIRCKHPVVAVAMPSWRGHEVGQAVGGPRAGASGGGSRGLPRYVRIFRIGAGSVMKAMSRMSPPQFGHASGNSSPTLAISLAQAIRDVSWEGLAPAA